MKMKFRYAAVSDIGNIRNNNEDNLYAPKKEVRDAKDDVFSYNGVYISNKAFFCVCDGMGGHSAGEVASYIAAQQVNNNYQIINDQIKSVKDIAKVMNDFISSVNDSVYKTTEKRPELKSMGTTLTGIYFLNDKGYFVNIGDSRAYELRGKTLVQLTSDHSDAENHHALTRFLGMSSQYGKVYPDVAPKGAAVGLSRRFLLCTDGLTDMVDDSMIQDILIETKKPKAAVEKLVETAKKNGGKDNITVFVIDASPINKFHSIMKSKITLAVIAAALLAGAGSAYYVTHKPAPVGISYTDLSNEVKNAKDLDEANASMDAQIAMIDQQLETYKSYSESVDDSDGSVASKNDELKQKAAELDAALADIKNKYTEINGSEEMSDVEKMNAVKSLAGDRTAQELIDQCSTLKNETETALADWQRRKEAEEKAEKRRQEDEAKKKENKERSNSTSGGASSSGRGSSGSSSGNSGSSVGSSRGSSSSGSSSGSSSSGGSSYGSSSSSGSSYGNSSSSGASSGSSSAGNSSGSSGGSSGFGGRD